MKIAIGSDKSGFSLKEAIKAYLKSEGYDFDDLGTTDLEKVKPYFEVAKTVAPLVQNGTYDRAILICGTGAGMSIVANKYKGVYSVACESVYAARMAKVINGAQIISMGGWLIAPEMGVEMAKAFLNAERFQDIEEWRKEWLTNADKKVKETEDGIYGK
jgi:ribose 5-phosphate isomerase B